MERDFNVFFEAALFQCLGKEIKVDEYFFTSGGCINNTAQLKTNEGLFFIKWNEPEFEDLFSTEAKGLEILASANKIKIPGVVGFGKVLDKVFLILEWIESGSLNNTFWKNFGNALAALHKNSNQKFGLDHENFIGALPQKNSFKSSGIDFFIENRLDVQIGLAYYNGHITKEFLNQFKGIYKKLPDLLPDEQPALLHGDLWSGNYIAQRNGQACLIDPAVHYGNRESELAFTKLFGGFDNAFYNSYQDSFPLIPGFESRVDIYNMYYLLVHVNLFGTSYLAPVERTVKALLK